MKVYWITRRDQLEAIAGTVRQDIADRLSAMGPCTVAALADALGYRPTALYQHLAALQRVGLVKSQPSRGGRGRPATHYRMIAPLVRWSRAPRLQINREPMARAARALATRAAKDYARGFDVPHWTLEGPGRNHWMFRLVARLSKKRLARINRLLDEVARLAYTPDPGSGPLVSVACLLAPIPERARRVAPARAGRRRR
ncbi:MAG TPA: helix-turn-helix domain-containing protein [Steroidobacteraceae bacterium]|nr:helix-turn-helix domain-containing protein [Steroidobacteraceae bacterium]